MLMPKKIKYRKVQRGTQGLVAQKELVMLLLENMGLQAVEPVWLTAQQIEAMRVTMSRKLKKVGKLFLRVFPDKPVTKKPAETRMGKGKGNVNFGLLWLNENVLFLKLLVLMKQQQSKYFKSAAYKLPMKTRFVKKAELIPEDGSMNHEETS